MVRWLKAYSSLGWCARGRRCRWLRALPGGAAEQGFDADEEDVEVEGLGEVVVGAGFETFEDVLGTGACGQHQDGGVVLGFAEGANDLEAVVAGKHAVEYDGVDGFGGVKEVGEGSVAVGLVMGAVALGLKVEEKALGEMFFVFDDGDERGCAHAFSLMVSVGVSAKAGAVAGLASGSVSVMVVPWLRPGLEAVARRRAGGRYCGRGRGRGRCP